MKLLSIAIPTYEMHGHGAEFLRHSLEILTKQTFSNFDIVISDHSKNDSIKNLCTEYKMKLDIKYLRYTENYGNSSANINNAIKNCSGKLIKILFQDDFMYHDNALSDIVNNFNLKKDRWLVTASEHSKDGYTFYRPYYPRYTKDVHLGNNRISSPSVLTILNHKPLFFDEKIIWLMDVDYYKRCYMTYGKPKVLNRINVVNRTGEHQVSNTYANDRLRRREYEYILKKYNARTKLPLDLKLVTLVAVTSIKIEETIASLKKSMRDITYHSVLLISDKKPDNLPEGIIYKKCDPMKNIDEYSKFMLYDLAQYIESEFALIVQYDSYVLRPEKWTEDFFNYDYIGAPFPKKTHYTSDGIEVRVGNGGFSLRSKKMLNILNELKLPFTDGGTGSYNEDGVICNYYRKKLEENGIKFANIDIASRFSCENICDDSHPEPFGFHKNEKLLDGKLSKINREIILYIQKMNRHKIESLLKRVFTKFKSIIKVHDHNKIVIKFNKNDVVHLVKKSDPVIMEIGCANGDDTVEFMKIFDTPNTKFYCFEPEPKNIKLLRDRINDQRFSLFEGVVSDIDGNLNFNRSRTNNPEDLSFSGSIMKPKNHLKIWDWIYFDQAISVKSTTLDSFAKNNSIKIIDFLWCDAQGAEEKIILGGEKMFREGVRFFYTEYYNNEMYENQPQLKRILKLLPNYEVVKDYGTDVLLKNKNII